MNNKNKLSLLQARVGANLSQKDIAAKMGMHVQTYARYEKNPAKMSMAQAYQFAQLVGLTIDDIFFSNNSN